MRLEDLVERASQYDETLARDIKDFVRGRKYGLVYEASKPEFVRMWKKPVVRGDLVNILPPRGVMEDTKRDDDPAEIVYKVIGISGGIAKLRNEETGEETQASVEDIVALARFDRPIYAGLKEVDRVERGGDKPYHVVINGENYHALQTLVYAYQGMVDCIYIDPPYNGEQNDWKYNNNYVSKDDKYKHSKWLTFMEDRLKLAKKLLNLNDSVLIVTIDEKEYLRLGLLLEQYFPEASIQMISSVINASGVARNNEFYRTDEYIYILRFGGCKPAKLDLADEWLTANTTGKDKLRWRRIRRQGSHDTRADAPNQFYPIYISKDGTHLIGTGRSLSLEEKKETFHVPTDCMVIWPLKPDGTEGCWQISQNSIKELLTKGYIKVTYTNKWGYTPQYLAKGERLKVENGQFPVIGYDEYGTIITEDAIESAAFIPGTQWRIPSHNAREYGAKVLRKFFPEKRFDYPKSLYAVQDVLRFFVKEKQDALVMDFFAGSGSTLHAINLINAEDNGHRRCICVTNNEVSVNETISLTEQRLRPGDDAWERLGIARYVTWPRVKCAIEGVDVNGNPLKGDYGCWTETYEEYEGEVIDPETGKKKRKKLYEKVKKPSYPELVDYKMADGFEENAIFFDLEYLEPAVVGADLAYESIAPILWMRGGCKGEILARQKSYVIGETYAVLFDPRYTKRFVDEVTKRPDVQTIFIVTDVAERYRSLCAELPGRSILQLYESYLRSFEINAIG